MSFASTLGGARLGQYRLAQTVSGLFVPASFDGAVSVAADVTGQRWARASFVASFSVGASVTASVVIPAAFSVELSLAASVAAQRYAIGNVDAHVAVTSNVAGARAASARIEATITIDGTISAMFHGFGNSSDRRIIVARRPRHIAIARQVRGTYLPASSRRQAQPQEDRTQWAA